MRHLQFVTLSYFDLLSQWFQVLHSRVGFLPFQQTLDKDSKKLARFKHSSLLWTLVNYGRKNFAILIPGETKAG